MNVRALVAAARIKRAGGRIQGLTPTGPFLYLKLCPCLLGRRSSMKHAPAMSRNFASLGTLRLTELTPLGRGHRSLELGTA